MKNSKNKFSKSMIIPITLGLILLLLFKSADSKLEQLLIGSIFIMVLIPFTLQLFAMLFSSTLSVPKSERNAELIISKEKNKSKKEEITSIKQNYKAKTNNNKFYIDVRNRLISVVKSGDINRDGILKLKLELDNRLGMNRYAYSNFNFENDMHEIYIKLKSSKLTDEDYIYLGSIIEDLVG